MQARMRPVFFAACLVVVSVAPGFAGRMTGTQTSSIPITFHALDPVTSPPLPWGFDFTFMLKNDYGAALPIEIGFDYTGDPDLGDDGHGNQLFNASNTLLIPQCQVSLDNTTAWTQYSITNCAFTVDQASTFQGYEDQGLLIGFEVLESYTGDPFLEFDSSNTDSFTVLDSAPASIPEPRTMIPLALVLIAFLSVAIRKRARRPA
jgi:hypothetical protein